MNNRLEITALSEKRSELLKIFGGLPLKKTDLNEQLESLNISMTRQVADDHLSGQKPDGATAKMREDRTALFNQLFDLDIAASGLSTAINELEEQIQAHERLLLDGFTTYVDQNISELLERCRKPLIKHLGELQAFTMLKNKTTRNLCDPVVIAERFARANRFEIDTATTQALQALQALEKQAASKGGSLS